MRAPVSRVRARPARAVCWPGWLASQRPSVCRRPRLRGELLLGFAHLLAGDPHAGGRARRVLAPAVTSRRLSFSAVSDGADELLATSQAPAHPRDPLRRHPHRFELPAPEQPGERLGVEPDAAAQRPCQQLAAHHSPSLPRVHRSPAGEQGGRTTQTVTRSKRTRVSRRGRHRKARARSPSSATSVPNRVLHKQGSTVPGGSYYAAGSENPADCGFSCPEERRCAPRRSCCWRPGARVRRAPTTRARCSSEAEAATSPGV